MYIYIYIHIHISPGQPSQTRAHPARRTDEATWSDTSLGAKDCTPEISTSEIIVDFRLTFSNRFSFCEIWCVRFCPETCDMWHAARDV